MNCFVCKGHVSNKFTTFMVDLNHCIVIVKNVPSQVCDQCGETSYSDEIAKHLEKIVNNMREAVMEIAVINYSDQVAA